jgi:UDP-N-acetylmuramate--alanine ligase
MQALNDIVQKLIAGDTAHKGSIYFVGIGGIGMSALARFFNAKGVAVSGYDRTETVLCKQLVQEGISIHYEDNVALIDKQAAVVVYTPAIPKAHAELNYLLDNGYLVVKRSDMLGAITHSSFNVCVAGTHGKTTTSTMVAHLLRHSGFGCNAFLGGISANYQSNFWSSENNVCVVEADEYDRSFLKLSPDMAIITSMDPDHLDIYGTPDQVEQAFIDFSARVKDGGLLIPKYGLTRGAELKYSNNCSYAAADMQADMHAENIRIAAGAYCLDVVDNKTGWKLADVVLNMGGLHNVENVIAAIAVAKHLQIADDKIKEAVAAFRGVKRRFEYIIAPGENQNGIVQIDDYAHHPEELRNLIEGARALFAGRKCTVIFQPHLFSRTRDFADGFAAVLSMADELILLPIYPARELPMEGVTSEMIANLVVDGKVKVLSKEAMLAWVENNEVDVLITAGAGDIDTLVQPICNILKGK